MSDVKKPMAGEWWEFTDGFRLFVVGKKLNGSLLCQTDCGAIEVYAIGGDEWKHLPDCDSFDWKPEVFPQYWTTLDRDSTLPESAAFVIRTNKTNWKMVWKNGHEGICMGVVSKWSPSGRTQITKEQAEALLLTKARTVVIIRWLCWNEDGKERIVQAANRPTGFLNCLNVGTEKFEVSP